MSGIIGTFEIWVDTTNGRYSTVNNAGPLSGAYGYDGKDAWRRDAKGVVFIQGGPSSMAYAVTEVFRLSYSLFKPNYAGAKVRYVGTVTEAGKKYEALSVQPAGGYAEEQWFDPTTGLLARATSTLRGRAFSTTTEAYQLVNGLMVPTVITLTTDTAQENLKVTNVQADTGDLEPHLKRPNSNPTDYSLTGNETTVPIDLFEDHIFVDVRINGKGPFHFWFDTGGRNIIDPTVAVAAGMHVFGETRLAMGIGSRAHEIAYAQADEVAIGGAKLTAQNFTVTQVGPRSDYFSYWRNREVQGLIGYELPARFLTKIDYGKGQLVLGRAESTNASNDNAIALTFDSTIPVVKCSIRDVASECALDTGSPWVLLTTPFVQAHTEVVPYWHSASGFIAAGFAGASKGKMGTLGSLQLGSQNLKDVDAIYSADTKGVLSDPFFPTIVGQRVLKRFIATLDYKKNELTLTPGATVPEP